MRPDLFKERSGQARLLARDAYALDPTPPLLDEAQFMENPTDHPISQLRYTLPNTLNSKAKRQNAGVLHFDAVIKDGYPDGSAPLSA